MEFRLKIEMGNAAMLTSNDVAESLKKIASYLEDFPRRSMKAGENKIRDYNGNTVGEWEFIADE